MTLTIDRLITCLPEPELYADELRQKLIGEHRLRRRVGDRTIELTIDIHDVEVKHEGIGAVQDVIDQGLILPGEAGIAAFFDFGRNTAIRWLVDFRGSQPKILWKSREAVEAGGLHRLLIMIEKDEDLRDRIGKAPNSSLVLEGISSGSFRYGKASFKDIFERYAQLWLRSVKNPAFKEWETSNQGWLDELDKMFFVGGAAPVAKIWTDDPDLNEDGWMAIPESPQFANIRGLMPKETPGAVCVVDPGSGFIKIATAGGIFKVESVSSQVFRDPKAGEIDEDSAFIDYLEGPAGQFKLVVGPSARSASFNPVETVHEEKGAMAEQLVLAALGPGLIQQQTTPNNTTSFRRRRAS